MLWSDTGPRYGVFIELFRKTRALGQLNEALEREVAEREEAQEALRRANHELEARVQERTAELTRLHRGVAENELRLRLAIEVASMAAWEWHLPSGRMTWSTDPEVLFGFPRGSFGVELRISGLLHPEDKAVTEQALATALNTGDYEVEYRAVRPDGSIVWLTDRGRVERDPEERPARMVGITRNVTAERQATQERERLLRDARQARDEAEAASRAKDEFLAMLSHELRNPLHVIAAGVAILDATGNPTGQLARTRELVSRQVRHLTNLMDDLLDIARVTSGKIVLSRHPIDLSAAVERCLGMLANTGRLGRHTWHTALQAAWVDADETRVEQIVTNLLSNAVKFTADGGDIAVRVSTQGAETVLVVEDSGVGISPALLPRIFELFVQGERSLDRTQGGLGLGLTLVRRLTEMHGGTVTAMSDWPGRGATFTVRLPNVPAPSEPDRRPAEVAAGAPLCILVVEDNPDGREMLRAMLEQDGHVVHEAADGPSAIDRALALHPDVAIVDIGLPEIDGYGVALRIRAAERGGTGTCLIALSGYGTEEDRRRTAQAGFDAHLTKPVEPDTLRLILTTRRRRGAHDDGGC